MMWLLIIPCAPFIILCIGLILSLKKRGKDGVKWRLNIALAIDRTCSACLGFPDRITISGHVGKKAKTSTNWMWKFYEKLIDLIFYEGHCRDSIGF